MALLDRLETKGGRKKAQGISHKKRRFHQVVRKNGDLNEIIYFTRRYKIRGQGKKQILAETVTQFLNTGHNTGNNVSSFIRENELLEERWTRVERSGQMAVDESKKRLAILSKSGANIQLTWQNLSLRNDFEKGLIVEIGSDIISDALDNEDNHDFAVKRGKVHLSSDEAYIVDVSGLAELLESVEKYSVKLLNRVKTNPPPKVGDIIMKDNESSNTDGIIIKKEKQVHQVSTEDANDFARGMGSYLSEARENGYVTNKQISEYFNEKNISSALGGTWSPSAVGRLIRRRQSLDLEKKGLKKKFSKKINKDYYRLMNKHLKDLRADNVKSTRKIADKFNELGIKTKTGKEWSHVTIFKLMKKLEELNIS